MTKRELALHLGISTVTLSKWIDVEPGWPVVERGRNGKPWLFHLSEVERFLGGQPRRVTGRANGGHAPQAEVPSTIRRSLDELRLSHELRRERERCAELLVAKEVEDIAGTILAKLQEGDLSFLRQVLTEQDVPAAVIRQAESRLSELHYRHVRKMAEALQAARPRDHGR